MHENMNEDVTKALACSGPLSQQGAPKQTKCGMWSFVWFILYFSLPWVLCVVSHTQSVCAGLSASGCGDALCTSPHLLLISSAAHPVTLTQVAQSTWAPGSHLSCQSVCPSAAQTSLIGVPALPLIACPFLIHLSCQTPATHRLPVIHSSLSFHLHLLQLQVTWVCVH